MTTMILMRCLRAAPGGWHRASRTADRAGPQRPRGAARGVQRAPRFDVLLSPGFISDASPEGCFIGADPYDRPRAAPPELASIWVIFATLPCACPTGRQEDRATGPVDAARARCSPGDSRRARRDDVKAGRRATTAPTHDTGRRDGAPRLTARMNERTNADATAGHRRAGARAAVRGVRRS